MSEGPEQSATDAELLAQHVSGDPEAFSTLVTRHQDRLWAVALRTLGNPEEAADAVQEAMIKAFRSAETFRGDAAVTTWLHRIVVNACFDGIRRRKVRATVPLDDDRQGESPRTPPAPDPAVQREQRIDVLAALQQLPEDQRSAIVLVDMEGYSIAEAAEILSCAPGTVKSRCSRGRARLAPLLEAWRNQTPTEGVPSTVRDASETPGGEIHGRPA